ncbi:hypothetical protein Tco_0394363 [Tanacetum coccineum]
MFEGLKNLVDDYANLVSGGANGLVNVSLSNFAFGFSYSCSSTSLLVIGVLVSSMIGVVVGECAFRSIVVKEGASCRVATELSGDTVFGISLKYSSNIG